MFDASVEFKYEGADPAGHRNRRNRPMDKPDLDCTTEVQP